MVDPRAGRLESRSVHPAPGGFTKAPDAQWEAFAAREPYFVVLTAAKFLRANLTDEHRREFFASGEALTTAIFRTIELRLAPHFAPTAILEYGCGAGRLVVPLARRAARRGGRVTAVDRSTAMLVTAQREASAHDVTNVTFLTSAALFSTPGGFDFITCYLVLQRAAPSEGLALLRALVARLVPGGIGVFHVPYRTGTSWPARYSRRLREGLPLVNGVANLLLGKPIGQPFVPSHIYDLDEVLAVFDDAGFATVQVVFDDQHDLGSVLVLAEAPIASRTTGGGGRRLPPTESATGAYKGHGLTGDGPIDVQAIIAGASLEQLNAAAEQYFATLTDVDHHLAKPFASAGEAPWLLTNMAVALQSLHVTPGAAVLEFGAGSGWLSRFLTQLGCRAILLDVSPTALRLARELYDRMPIIGDRPSPEFLLFDGERIDLPEGSVDRVLSFHAFHHAPNPETIIREFGRVLTPGGIAVFAEPGPQHSQAAQSQFEMRTYGVVENDVDVHDLWRMAREAGFADIKLSVFHGPAFDVSLEEYEDLLAGGPTGAEWIASTRTFLRNVRNFHLVKAGATTDDSRSASGLACAIHATRSGSGTPIGIDAIITNTGTARWLPRDVEHGGVGIGIRLYDTGGVLMHSEVLAQPLTEPARENLPGETVRVHVNLPVADGLSRVEIDCVAARVAWFSQIGSKTGTVGL